MILLLMLACTTGVPQAEQAGCPASEFVSSGNRVESRFFAAPVRRIREAVSDAMQAAGVLIMDEGQALVKGERRPNRVNGMGLAPGDESVSATILPAEQSGAQGAVVTIETGRSGWKSGCPGRNWSAAILNEADCLLRLLSMEEPTIAPPQATAASGTELEVVLPAGAPVRVYVRRFMFSTEMIANRRVSLEVASDVKVGEQTVIQRGAMAAGRITSIEGAQTTWRLKERQERAELSIEYVLAVGGERIAVSPSRTFGGRAQYFLWGDSESRGHFGLRAGTMLEAVTLKDEKIRVRGGRPGFR